MFAPRAFRAAMRQRRRVSVAEPGERKLTLLLLVIAPLGDGVIRSPDGFEHYRQRARRAYSAGASRAISPKYQWSIR